MQNMLAQIRKNITGLIDSLSIEQINQIPKGFNNNIIWNFGHVIVTQQLLCYKFSGNPILVENNLVELFRKGTSPTLYFDADYLSMLKELSNRTLSQFSKDLESGLFTNYNPYQTSFGVKLNTIQDAITFNNIHEGMHFGYVLAQRKALIG